MKSWSIQKIWNELLVSERELKPRNYIYASEIGQPYLDRYLKMKGVKPTNAFEPRVLRIFDCGHIFEEEVVERIFKILGIFIISQVRVVYKERGLLPVVGRHDPKVGGKINIEQSELELSRTDSNGIPVYSEWMINRTRALREALLKQYPNGMKIMTTEIKSINSNAFWAHKNIDPKTGFFKGYDHHKLQLFTYLMAQDESEGRLFYISKDDLTLMETPVYKDDETLFSMWKQDIEKMTEIYNSGIEPEKEPDITYNEKKKRYEINWAIKRSNYFTYITKEKDPDIWEKRMRKQIIQKNRAQCPECQKEYSLDTLDKYSGHCKRCFDKKNNTS